MALPPTVQDFKDKFTREFVYGVGGDAVKDSDISRALEEVPPLFNVSLLDKELDQKNAFLYAAAHMLVMNVQGAGGLSAVPRGRGVRNVGESVMVAKGVGGVSVTYQTPPPRIAASPLLLYFFRTDFGQRYIQLVDSRTAGPAVVVAGPTPEQFNQE